MSNKKEQDSSLQNDLEKWLEEEDPFGINEEMELVLFKCLDCKGTDEVPDYVIGEFSVGLNKGEEVELHCPHCNGTMRKAKDAPSD